jgi:hippurate hydrolase
MGHGPSPAALAILQYQVIVSRTDTPRETAVVAVGSVQAGFDNKVIPATALIKANLHRRSPRRVIR